MLDDAELLRRYVRDRSEKAFADLVNRHLAFVYAGALRRVGGDAHLAEDVSQMVFSDLARKAPTLAGRPSLSGWLYVSTHLATAEVVRKEQRRKAREMEAHHMAKVLSAESSVESEADWSRMRALLDELMLELKEGDREALALRFFEQRPLAEVGAALRLTEDAARKRVDRAVDKLRARLVERGVTSTAGAVTFARGETAASAAPAGLAAQIAGTAIAELAVVGTGTPLIVTIVNALTSKAAMVGVAIVAIVAGAIWQRGNQTRLRQEIASFTGEGAAIATLQQDNRHLSQVVEEVAALRERAISRAAVAALPVPESAESIQSAPSAPLNVVITGAGRVLWNGEGVSLDEFTRRLREFHSVHPEPEAGIAVIAEAGSSFSQASYVTDEARKAEVKDVSVQSAAKPEGKTSWFQSFPKSNRAGP
jgi:RNA polymerase sigma factor (sigma-70 family)